MMHPTRWRKWLYLAIAIIAMVTSSALHGPLLDAREAWSRTAVVQSFPPALVLGTQMLGSFRGMLVVGLWLRATALQEQRRYYELVQLYDWITQLEPGIQSVWAYAAWNMAYNVSVAFEAEKPEERWRWVRHGINLMLFRAMEYNPRSYLLNRELSWIFFHKIGRNSDDAHRYYKTEMAKELHTILGGPEPDYDRMAAAPKRASELLADEAVRRLVDQARAAGFDPLGVDIAWLNDPDLLPEAVRPILAPAEATAGGAHAALEAFLRARALYATWRIDPVVAKELVDKYGPLDFRQPEAHALYWASRSLLYVKPTESPIHGERLLYHSLVQICETGRLTYLPEIGQIARSPDIRFVDTAVAAFERLLGMPEFAQEAGLHSSYRYWMRNMIVVLYGYGRRQKAAELLERLYKFEPRPEHEGPAERFVVREIERDLAEKQYEQVAGVVRVYLVEYYSWLALGEQEYADALLAIAKVFHAIYMTQAPERYHAQLGPWEVLLAEMRQWVLDPERGFRKELRDMLRERLGMPPEEEKPSETAPAA